MKHTVIILMSVASTIISLSCTAQPHLLGERPLDLSELNFEMDFKRLVPEEYAQGFGFYEIPIGDKFVLMRESISLVTYDNSTGNVVWRDTWKYLRYNGHNIDGSLAEFGKQPFYRINFALTLDDKLMAIRAEIPDFAKERHNEFLKSLTDKYGEPKKETGKSLGLIYEYYTWELHDRTILYTASHFDKADDSSLAAQFGPENPDSYGVYFDIIKNEYIGQVNLSR